MKFEDWVAEKVRVKGRKFGTISNLPGPHKEAATPDKVEADAIAYTRASRGD
jgi:hypothetical protein